jgi:S-adenosylmethionine hydrolase
LNSNDSNPIEFEPLHTVDYFASQGIKITDEPVSSDKLGKQLKSFTEWIKSMKKIHASQPEVKDPQTDNKIQGIAEGSNIETEVVTEAMADVLVKQEKIAKAIEMYEKLSLNNPSKSAYFAAKIESLKSV